MHVHNLGSIQFLHVKETFLLLLILWLSDQGLRSERSACRGHLDTGHFWTVGIKTIDYFVF